MLPTYCYNGGMSKNTSKHPRVTAYIPQELLEALKRQAKENYRSMNNQLVVCLEQCLGVQPHESRERLQDRT
jgi:hypothetical protein